MLGAQDRPNPAIPAENPLLSAWRKPSGSYRVQHKDGSLALRGDEEAEEGPAALGAMVEVDVADAPYG